MTKMADRGWLSMGFPEEYGDETDDAACSTS
jgi:alkylation response protein AidB-like acyl-CoA dehydrogenase